MLPRKQVKRGCVSERPSEGVSDLPRDEASGNEGPAARPDPDAVWLSRFTLDEDEATRAAQDYSYSPSGRNRWVWVTSALAFWVIVAVAFVMVIRGCQSSSAPPAAPRHTWHTCENCGGAKGRFESVVTGYSQTPCDACGPGGFLWCGIPGQRKCSRCEGTGLEWDSRIHVHLACRVCGGAGHRFCMFCDGSGYQRTATNQQVWRNCNMCWGWGGWWVLESDDDRQGAPRPQ